MPDILSNIAMGFGIALTWQNIGLCLFGCIIGTAIGVLPGIGPVGTISLLLAATLHQSPTTAIIMLAGIYYGAMYGGSTTSILMNVPGESASVVVGLLLALQAPGRDLVVGVEDVLDLRLLGVGDLAVDRLAEPVTELGKLRRAEDDDDDDED